MKIRFALLPGIVAALLLCLVVEKAQAQLTTDLMLEMQVDPVKPVYFAGDVVRVDLTVTNLGPDASPGSELDMREFAFGPLSGQVWISALMAEIEPCLPSLFELPSSPNGPISVLIYPALAPGASQTCSVSLHVGAAARTSYLLGAMVYPDTPVAVDPDTSNNSVDRLMAIYTPPSTPAVIPASSFLTLLILLLGITALALRTTGGKS